MEINMKLSRSASRSVARWASGTVFAAILSTYAAVAAAAPFTTFNTGVDASGTPLALGATDPHWLYVAGPNLPTPANAIVLTNQHPSGQYFATTDSLWISRLATGSVSTNTPYTYELAFNLTGFDASTAVLSGIWGVDNFGSILLNGVAPSGTGTFSLAGTQFSHFNSTHAFTINGGFLSGINKLQVQVVDTGNPSGFNVSALSGSATPVQTPVPEPASLMLLSSGLVGLGLWKRFRAKR
jgi:hypothetical protein